MSNSGADENEARHCQTETEPLASEADGPKPSFCIDRSTCSEWLAGLVGFGAFVVVELYNLPRTSFTFYCFFSLHNHNKKGWLALLNALTESFCYFSLDCFDMFWYVLIFDCVLRICWMPQRASKERLIPKTPHKHHPFISEKIILLSQTELPTPFRPCSKNMFEFFESR